MSESTPGRSTYNGGKTRVTDSSVLSSKLTPQDLQDLLALLPTMVPAERQTLLQKLQKFEELQARETAQTDFLSFVGRMWPEFIMGRHHKKMARAFERVANGKCKRLIINMPPRHTKSEFASYLLPAWFLGRFPQKKVSRSRYLC